MTQRVGAENSKQRFPIFWIYLIFGLLLLILIASSGIKMLRDAPNVKASVDLPGSGWVTVQFSTSPNPPLTTGTVLLSFMPVDNQMRMVDLGQSLPFTYGQRGSDKQTGSGQAVLDATGMNYQAGVQFPAVGDYWLVLDLGSGKQVHYQFSVRPAQ